LKFLKKIHGLNFDLFAFHFSLQGQRADQAKYPRTRRNKIQVALAIRRGYVPGKSSTANTKTAILSFK